MPKVIRSGVREVALKVKEFCIKEKQSIGPINPFEKVNERVAAMTGVSLLSVASITGEGILADASSSKIFTLGKNRKTMTDRVLLDNFDIGALRRTILTERNYISAWLARYLQAIKHNKEAEKLPVVYLDETYIHSGLTVGKCWQNDDDDDDCETDGVLQPISKGQWFIIVHAGGEQGFVENTFCF